MTIIDWYWWSCWQKKGHLAVDISVTLVLTISWISKSLDFENMTLLRVHFCLKPKHKFLKSSYWNLSVTLFQKFSPFSFSIGIHSSWISMNTFIFLLIVWNLIWHGCDMNVLVTRCKTDVWLGQPISVLKLSCWWFLNLVV